MQTKSQYCKTKSDKAGRLFRHDALRFDIYRNHTNRKYNSPNTEKGMHYSIYKEV